MKWFLLIAVLVAPASEDDLIARIAASGRCVSVAETPDYRVGPGLRIAPGPPPLVSFRYYQGKLHQRLGNSDLMLDDAGH
ncbi:MAG TPA: hypothetical protein VGK64_21990 [Bryobacteraceae bacterium]